MILRKPKSRQRNSKPTKNTFFTQLSPKKLQSSIYFKKSEKIKLRFFSTLFISCYLYRV